MGGDFNLVLDVTLDRSSTKPQNLTKSAEFVNNFMDQCGLSDVWRFQFPHTRAYFFTLQYRLLQIIFYLTTDCYPRLQHAFIVILDRPPPNRMWRFNPLLLSDKKCIDLSPRKVLLPSLLLKWIICLPHPIQILHWLTGLIKVLNPSVTCTQKMLLHLSPNFLKNTVYQKIISSVIFR